MVERIDGLTYGELSRLLAEYGWAEIDSRRGRTYEHVSGAKLLFPPMRDDERVVAYHLTAVRAAFADYGILPYEVFDLRILPFLVGKHSKTGAAI